MHFFRVQCTIHAQWSIVLSFALFADMPQFKQKISSKHARLHTLRQCNDFECRQACETFFC